MRVLAFLIAIASTASFAAPVPKGAAEKQHPLVSRWSGWDDRIKITYTFFADGTWHLGGGKIEKGRSDQTWKLDGKTVKLTRKQRDHLTMTLDGDNLKSDDYQLKREKTD